MIKKIVFNLLICLGLLIPINCFAECELTFSSFGDDHIVESSDGSVGVIESTVASGDVLVYKISASHMDVYGQVSSYNKKIKITPDNANGVNCTIVPIDTTVYSYTNGVFTTTPDKVPVKSQIVEDGFSMSGGEIEVAYVKCTMPTTDKYRQGVNFKITAEFEKVQVYGDGDKVENITQVLTSKISLVNVSYLNSLQKPTVELETNLEGATLDGACNKDSFFCNAETTNDKITLKYNLKNNDFSLGYQTGKYVDLFDVRDIKEFKLNNRSGSVTINLDYGNTYLGFGVLEESDNSEYGRIARILDEYPSFECSAEDADLDTDYYPGYAYIINRIDARSNDSTLKSLSISNATINFNQNLKNYFVDVANDVTEVTITSQLNHGKASYVNGFGNRKVKLNEGKNEVLIKVKAENGSESVYSITITRSLSNNNNLTSISVDDKVIKMIKNKLKYTINVNNEITKVNITGVTEHEKATITVDNKDLVVGSNIISITVTAPNGEKKIYELDIVRDDLISTNADLKNIIISGYKLDFSSNVKKYNLTIKDEDELDIKVITDSDKAKYLITGNSKLKDGSIIKIKVTAEDKKTENIYEINITKEKKSFPILLILGICAGVGLLVVIIVVLTKKPKDNSLQAVTEVTTDSLNNNLIDEQIANTIVVDQIVETTEINDNNNNNNNVSKDVVTTEEPVLVSSEEVKTTSEFDDDII